MPELFIELFSEEMPPKLQVEAREKIKEFIDEKLKKKEINFKSSKSFSTPKRLVFIIDGLPKNITRSKKTIKGPITNAPQVALEGFIKSNKLNKKDVYKKKNRKRRILLCRIKSSKNRYFKGVTVNYP